LGRGIVEGRGGESIQTYKGKKLDLVWKKGVKQQVQGPEQVAFDRNRTNFEGKENGSLHEKG